MNGDIELCRSVEKVAGKEPRTPKDFEELRDSISHRTGVLLSSTTLKRIWGYLDEPQAHRRSTLDVLARYCGWADYSEFEAGADPEAESGPVGSGVLMTEKTIHPKDRIRLLWNPGRVCDVEYQGNGIWRVVASEGTRLKAGDTFICRVIMQGEPLYLNGLKHGELPPSTYVCGRRSGITWLRI